MGLLAKLRNAFGPGEQPDQEFVDSTLGTMRWVEDDEAWFGEFNSIRYALSYERTRRPEPALIEYACAVIGEPIALQSALDDAKRTATAHYGDAHAVEIASLVLGRLHFYEHGGTLRIIGDLEGGRDNRAWRIEFKGKQCEGIGFDS